jgi:hypothetical protein
MTTLTKYCYNCGVAIDEPSAFCGSCGAALTEPATAETPPSGNAAERSTASASPNAGRPMSKAAADDGRASQLATSAGQDGSPPGQPAGSISPDSTPPSQNSRKWIPFAAVGGAAVVVAGLVATLLLALGGSAGTNVKGASVTREQALALLAANGTTTVSNAAPGLFALVTTGKLSTIVPAGWRATAQVGDGTSRAEFADPKHSGSTLTIVAQAQSRGSDHGRANAANQAVHRKGYTVSAYGHIEFPGGREVWRLTYADPTATHETYFFSACNGGTAMVVGISAASSAFHQQQPALEAAAASAEPLC